MKKQHHRGADLWSWRGASASSTSCRSTRSSSAIRDDAERETRETIAFIREGEEDQSRRSRSWCRPTSPRRSATACTAAWTAGAVPDDARKSGPPTAGITSPMRTDPQLPWLPGAGEAAHRRFRHGDDVALADDPGYAAAAAGAALLLQVAEQLALRPGRLRLSRGAALAQKLVRLRQPRSRACDAGDPRSAARSLRLWARHLGQRSERDRGARIAACSRPGSRVLRPGACSISAAAPDAGWQRLHAHRRSTTSAPMLGIAAGKPGLRGRLAVGRCGTLARRDCRADLVLCTLSLGHVRERGARDAGMARAARAGRHADRHAIFIPEASARGWKRTFRSDGRGLREWRIIRTRSDELRRRCRRPGAGRDRGACFGEPERRSSKSPASRAVRQSRDPRLMPWRADSAGAWSRGLDALRRDSHRGPRCSSIWAGHVMMPGLINAHDHLEFNLYPRLGRGPYPNAGAWARDIYHPERSPGPRAPASAQSDAPVVGRAEESAQRRDHGLPSQPARSARSSTAISRFAW